MIEGRASTKEITLSLFSDQPLFYDSELPVLWKEELAEILLLPGVAGEVEVEVAVSSILYEFDTPAREMGLSWIQDYASKNLSFDNGVLPPIFYHVLKILAESRIRLLREESFDGRLNSNEEVWIRRALDGKWLDIESQTALNSLLSMMAV